jgi:hypothetical protein
MTVPVPFFVSRPFLISVELHVPEEVRKRLQIDYEVNLTDPDFNFYKAVFGKERQKPIPLRDRYAKHFSAPE